MSSTRQSLFWMFVYLAVVAGICAALILPLKTAFMANWGFNSLIIGVMFVGMAMTFRQVLVLQPELDWIKLFRTGEAGLSLAREPRLLKPLSRHISNMRKDRFRLSALSMRAILDGIRERLDESRELSRYLMGTLIFLGLLGTFWGLLGTISAVGQVINGLDVGERDFASVFADLKAGLDAPLTGMGTAFSSSLFGLGGSLVLGFLDLQAGHAQNRFFNHLEEWLSGVTQFVDDPSKALNARDGGLSGAEGSLFLLIEEIREERKLLARLLDDKDRGANDKAGEG